MWVLKEHRDIKKTCRKLPLVVVKKYELWKSIIFHHGLSKLRAFSAFHDEKLKGRLQRRRSSRLSLQYRVIYSINKQSITIFVLEITPHKYWED